LIAKLSERAHELAKCIYSNNKPDDCKNINAKEELKKIEEEIDLAVAELYGITKEELEGFRELMNILSGKWVLLFIKIKYHLFFIIFT